MSKNLQDLLDELEVEAKTRAKIHEQETLKKERTSEMLKWFLTFLLPLGVAGFVFFEGLGIARTLLNSPNGAYVLSGILIGFGSIGIAASIVAWVFTYATESPSNP